VTDEKESPMDNRKYIGMDVRSAQIKRTNSEEEIVVHLSYDRSAAAR